MTFREDIDKIKRKMKPTKMLDFRERWLIMKTYKKPVVTVDAGMAEGVYAASGASQGTLNVTYKYYF